MIIVIIPVNVATENLIAVAEGKATMDFYINQAIDNGALKLMQYKSSGEEVVNKEKAVESFFNSLYASLGILSDSLACERILAYVPVILVTTDNGYYLMYQDVYIASDNKSYISKRWTEKIPYVYEDDNFIYQLTTTNNVTIYDKNNVIDSKGEDKLYKINIRSFQSNPDFSRISSMLDNNCLLRLDESDYVEVRQQAIISQIENDLSWYVSRHNDIAKKLGISYGFAMPVINASDWQKALEGTGIMVFFQGMPLQQARGEFYNNFAFAGAGLRKKAAYYIEQKDWFYIYHKESCSEIEENLYISREQYDTVEECARLGAYSCEICCPGGVHAPSYEP